MLVKRFELVGSLLHTCRPWSDVVNACNGMGMKFKCTIEGASEVCSSGGYDRFRSSCLGKG